MIKIRNGENIRFSFGIDSTYFAVDTSTREFITNIESADFNDWLAESSDKYDTRTEKKPTLRNGYVPHCLVFGPDDMFCWIAKKVFKVNDAFDQAFPGIKRFLEFSKAKKSLEKVVSLN